jgi:hypothetical protein
MVVTGAVMVAGSVGATAAAASAPLSPQAVTQPVSGLPAPSTSGPLRIEANIPLHLTWVFKPTQPQPIATEAPDGAVFVTTGSTIYVVDGDHAPQVAEHATGPVVALAADGTDLYVETGLTVTDYSRQSGDEVRTWSLPAPGPCPGCTPTSAVLLAQAGVVWSLTNFSTDSSGLEPGTLSRMGPLGVKLVDSQAYPYFTDADASGIYYETLSGRLAHVTPSGARTVSSASSEADAPLALSDGKLVLEPVQEPAGKPLWQTWDPSTLRVLTSTAPAPNSVSAFENTGAGLLGFSKPSGGHGTSVAVSRANISTGAASGTVQFSSVAGKAPYAGSWILEGYYPSIVNAVGRNLYLIRLV